MMTKIFTRTKEDFTCEHCGQKVQGDGYTNHCPACLWGKHVDVNPGDRQEACQGMMEPIAINIKSSKYIITHRCLKCGIERKNKTSKNDNFDVIIKLSSQS